MHSDKPVHRIFTNIVTPPTPLITGNNPFHPESIISRGFKIFIAW